MRNILLILVAIIVSCKQNTTNNDSEEKKIALKPTETAKIQHQAISLLGDTLYAFPPTAALLEKYYDKQNTYLHNDESLDALIWYGRFTAYTGDYIGAIALYGIGLKEWPNQSRLLRHRGHRYISIREFDKAIADLSLAAQLIEGTENSMEADGIPNAQNTPVSSKHGNIYYHLGLAHYLKGNMQEAADAYTKALLSSTNPDNIVSTTHWLYMINRRMGDLKKAESVLLPIASKMNVIENHSYLNACLFYKEMLSLDEVYKPNDSANPSDSAINLSST